MNINFASTLIGCRLLFLILCFSFVSSQIHAQIPHLQGNVQISVKNGTIKCDFSLSNLPSLGKKYKILINKGMNIYNFYDDGNAVINYKGFHSPKSNGVSLEYLLAHINGDSLSLPSKIRIKYQGWYPVYNDTASTVDYQMVIGFNGKTVKASDYSSWYPVIYDLNADKLLHNVTYDISIDCNDCQAIYLNGSEPIPNSQGTFVSSSPVSPFLFAGEFSYQSIEVANFLNCSIPQKEAVVFTNVIDGIKRYYNEKFDISYNQKVTFIQHQPIKRNANWAFVIFPSFIFANAQLKDMVNVELGGLKDFYQQRFFAHEMGHYYFGTLLKPNSTLYWFFLESTAEYLGLKNFSHVNGIDKTKQYLNNLIKSVSDKKVIPLNQITKQEQIDNDYRYTYGPLILFALEQLVGEQKVFALLRRMVVSNSAKTDYHFFKTCAMEAGITVKQWNEFESEVVSIVDCKNIASYLVLK